MMHHPRCAPVSNRFFTRGVWLLIGLALAGAAAGIYRLLAGLGMTTHLDNQHPWGIWIAIDVASGVALAAGGFTTAALVHIFHRERYEEVVRPALLTAMLGYTFVVLGLMMDLGRYYNLWHPVWPTMWQGNSVLFEVGMCVMIYLNVLYLEFAPMVCERFIGRVHLPGPLAAFNPLVDAVLRFMQSILGRVMSLFIIAGVVLSCMHQSSLGALMLIAPYKVSPLWYTPILPLLFLLSAVSVGFPMVVFESLWASWAFNRKPEMSMLTPLSKLMALLVGVYGAAKISDFVVREAYVHLADNPVASVMFLIEVGLGVLTPFTLLLSNRVRRSPRLLFLASSLVVGGVLLNRVNVFLVAYRPPYAVATYFPSIWEILVTVGLVSALVLAYRALVTILPVLSAEHRDHTAFQNPVFVQRDIAARPHRREAVGSLNVLSILFMAAVGVFVAGAGFAQMPMPASPENAGDCSSCHSSATPSRDDLYQSPCRRPRPAPNPNSDAVAKAPDVFILDQLSEIYVPVVFPHKLHASMEAMGNGCSVCHHHDEPGKTRTCRECHNGSTNPANLRQPGLKGAYHRQCLACHREWSHDTDCVLCHAKREAGKPIEPPPDPTDIMGRLHPNVSVPEKRVYPTPNLEEGTKVTFLHKEHTELYGRRCVDCHVKENCSRCHDQEAPHEKHVRQDPHEDCIKCHDTSGDCSTCHRQDESTGFDHAKRSKFPLKAYHRGLACSKCHTDEKTFVGPKPECSTCHAPNWAPVRFDHSKTGLTLDEAHADAECAACHPAGMGKPTQCNSCHDDGRQYPDKSPGAATASQPPPRAAANPAQ